MLVQKAYLFKTKKKIGIELKMQIDECLYKNGIDTAKRKHCVLICIQCFGFVTVVSIGFSLFALHAPSLSPYFSAPRHLHIPVPGNGLY